MAEATAFLNVNRFQPIHLIPFDSFRAYDAGLIAGAIAVSLPRRTGSGVAPMQY